MAFTVNTVKKSTHQLIHRREKDSEYLNLQRCKMCQLKFERHKLTLFSGNLVCKFCLNSFNKGVSDV